MWLCSSNFSESRSDRIGFSKYFKKVPLKPSCWLEWWGQPPAGAGVVQVWREFSSRFFLGPVLSLLSVPLTNCHCAYSSRAFPAPYVSGTSHWVWHLRVVSATARLATLQNCHLLQQRVLCCPWQILLEFVISLMMSHCIPSLFFWSKKSHVATARCVRLVMSEPLFGVLRLDGGALHFKFWL